jgi:hypothetical protein
MNPVVLQSLITSLQDAIEQKTVNANSAMAIIGKGMELMGYFKDVSGPEKKKYLIKAIEIVAKGKDGVFGTDDDLIPESTAKTLTMLLEQNLVEDTIQLISDAAKGKLNVEQVKKVGKGCVTACGGLWAAYKAMKKNRKSKVEVKA